MSLVTLLAGPLIEMGKEHFARKGRIKAAKEEAAIEAIRTRSKNPGYMDDFLLFLHAGPIVGVFFPQTREHTMEGIEALSALPEWYLAVWFTMIAGVWGAPKLADLKMKR